MGKHFGNLAHVNRIIYYGLSPFEQKAFPNFWKTSPQNVLRRVRGQFLKMALPFGAVYALVKWSNKENDRASRKNPEDYVNDQ